MNPVTHSRPMLAHTTDVTVPSASTTGDATLRPGLRVAGFAKKVSGCEVERAQGTLERDELASVGLVVQRHGAQPHDTGRTIGNRQVVVEAILDQRVHQFAPRRRRQRDDVWIRREHGKPVRPAGDTVVHLALQQPNDPRRQIGQGSEAAFSRQPFVVDQDHERRHQGDEHQREEACSHRRQNGREPIEYADSLRA